MGEGLIVTAVNGGMPPGDITVAEPDPARAAALREAHGVRTGDLADGVPGADVVALVVKPHILPEVMPALRSLLTDGQLIVSLVLGVRIPVIEAGTKLASPAVIRACPNLAIARGSGFTAIAGGAGVQPGQFELAEGLFRTGGPVARVTEPQLDAVSVVSGSVPAWYCYVVEAMTDAGVLLGLGHELSALIAARGLVGAASLVGEGDRSAVQIRAAVSSPGGATIAGVRVLEERAVRGAFLAASAAGVDRARQAAADYEKQGEQQ
jgi:pyrroline-5-carboxylate reductase